ncbi:MAG TPA: hypothetical protein PLL57_08605 [Flavobacteriales bacterium]|nr:hypothetical protein [Flavobacteriales bacterium]
MVNEVVLEMGAQDKVIAGVDCTVAVTLTAALSETDWADSTRAVNRKRGNVRERSMLDRGFNSL